MRVVDFSGDNREKYNIMYEGLLATNTHGGETRLLSKVLLKMEDIGVPKGNTFIYVLEKDGKIVLEDAEYDLVKKLLDTVEWNGVGAKKAGVLMEWLDKIPAQPALEITK
jgi:hypothetical protein